MAKYGFLSVLEEELDKGFSYDYELNWDKRNHAVELSFILDAANTEKIATMTADGEVLDGDIALEEFVIFYDPSKSRFEASDYLVALPFLPKKGYSREFLAYFAAFLQETADQGLDGILDFLEDESQEEFTMTWDEAAFEEGKKVLDETDFYPYPRY